MIAIAEPIDADALRVRHEFLIVPNLHASADDVAVVLDVSSHHAADVLDSLTRDGFLARAADGRYVRRQERRLQ